MDRKKDRAVRQISVSQKRQIPIPKVFCDAFGIGQEVICEMRDNKIVLRNIPKAKDFSEEILKDLVEKGFSGQDLIDEFQKVKSQIRPAIENLIEESGHLAQELNGSGDVQTKELFGI